MPKVALVASGKGGTGKSLFSINLALELKERGHSVSLIDADITSSYFRRFTNARHVLSPDKERIPFVDWNGIKVFSMSLLDTGPMSLYGFSERQILEDVYRYGDWVDTEYVVVDLPAGVEDVFKESIRLWARYLVGMYVVFIPFAAQSARQLVELGNYYQVPIMGLLENMAYMDCRHCGAKDGKIYPFGRPVGDAIAKEYGVPYLGQLPLDPRVYDGIEKGMPRIPEDIKEPIVKAADAFEESEPGKFYDSWKRRVKRYIRNEVAKVAAQLLVALNKEFDIKSMKEQYGFTGGKPFSLVVTDDEEKPLLVLNLKLKDNRLVIVKGRVKPQWVIEIPVRTLVDIFRGYREVGGRRLPFDAKRAWELGELKVYGKGSTPMAIYVLNKLFSNEAVLEEARKKLGGLISLLGD